MGTLPQADLFRRIEEANTRGERVVVATVAHTRGSTPQQRGAKMLFFESGVKRPEPSVAAASKQKFGPKRARPCTRGQLGLHHFALTADEASEEGMVCGGTMDIFIDVWQSEARTG